MVNASLEIVGALLIAVGLWLMWEPIGVLALGFELMVFANARSMRK